MSKYCSEMSLWSICKPRPLQSLCGEKKETFWKHKIKLFENSLTDRLCCIHYVQYVIYV